MAAQYFLDTGALSEMDHDLAFQICDRIMHRGVFAGHSVVAQPGSWVLTLAYDQFRGSRITVEATLLPNGVERVDVTGPQGGRRLIDNGTFLSALALSGIYKPA